VLSDDALDLVAGADRDGRLDDDDGEVLDDAGNVAGRVVHEAHVGRADLGERWRSDSDENRLRSAPGRLEAGREREPPRGLVGQYQFAQARLIDRHAAFAQIRHFALVDLDADHLVAEIGQTGPRH
jgi:hypothetical protein